MPPTSPTTGGPTRGCLVGLLALLPFALVILGVYALVTWGGHPAGKRSHDLFSIGLSSTLTGLLLGGGMIWLAIRIRDRNDD